MSDNQLNLQEIILKAVNHARESSLPFHTPILLIGLDWMYKAEVRNSKFPENKPYVVPSDGKNQLGTKDSITGVLQESYARNKSVTLIPQGEERIREARTLGEITNEQEYDFGKFYQTQIGKHWLSVYEITVT